MKFFILVIIPFAFGASIAASGWLLFEMKGAIVGGIVGLIAFLGSLFVYIKSLKSTEDHPTAVSTAQPQNPTKPPPKNTTPLPERKIEIKKIKISKTKANRSKKYLGILQNAQTLVKAVTRKGDHIIIDTTVVPSKEDVSFKAWYPGEIEFHGFATEKDANEGAHPEPLVFVEWKRWMQSTFKSVNDEHLRGSGRLEFTCQSTSPKIHFVRLAYENEFFGKAIALPALEKPAAFPTPAESAPASSFESQQIARDRVDAPTHHLHEPTPAQETIAVEGGDPPAILILHNGQQIGPFSVSDLWLEIGEGRVLLTDYAWYEGLEEWVPLSEVVDQGRI